MQIYNFLNQFYIFNALTDGLFYLLLGNLTIFNMKRAYSNNTSKTIIFLACDVTYDLSIKNKK
jgi:hypothetical protein